MIFCPYIVCSALKSSERFFRVSRTRGWDSCPYGPSVRYPNLLLSSRTYSISESWRWLLDWSIDREGQIDLHDSLLTLALVLDPRFLRGDGLKFSVKSKIILFLRRDSEIKNLAFLDWQSHSHAWLFSGLTRTHCSSQAISKRKVSKQMKRLVWQPQ